MGKDPTLLEVRLPCKTTWVREARGHSNGEEFGGCTQGDAEGVGFIHSREKKGLGGYLAALLQRGCREVRARLPSEVMGSTSNKGNSH